MSKRSISKVSRILSVYYLLLQCEEVSWQELAPLSHCKKTIQRDITLICQAGAVSVRFDRVRKAYVMEDKTLKAPVCVENKAQARQIQKLHRLLRALKEMPEEDCDLWYRSTFPEVSNRTMQRDFAELNKLDFEIRYERDLLVLGYDSGEEHPPGRYLSDRPDCFSLSTMQEL